MTLERERDLFTFVNELLIVRTPEPLNEKGSRHDVVQVEVTVVLVLILSTGVTRVVASYGIIVITKVLSHLTTEHFTNTLEHHFYTPLKDFHLKGLHFLIRNFLFLSRNKNKNLCDFLVSIRKVTYGNSACVHTL